MNTLFFTNNTQRSRRIPVEHASDVARFDQSTLTGHINFVIGLACCQTRILQRMHKLKDETVEVTPRGHHVLDRLAPIGRHQSQRPSRLINQDICNRGQNAASHWILIDKEA